MKCERCGEESGPIKLSCSQISCPQWTAVDVVLIPVSLTTSKPRVSTETPVTEILAPDAGDGLIDGLRDCF